MRVWAKDKNFSIGWTLGGALIMLIVSGIGGGIATAAGVHSVFVMSAIGMVCFAFGGFIIGWKSDGQTILEAGLAAAITTVVCAVIQYRALHLGPISLLIGSALPFGAGILGGWIGEKVQGDTITTDD